MNPAYTRGARINRGRSRLQTLVATLAALTAAIGLESGCLDRPIGTDEPRTTNIVLDSIQRSAVDKIDLLFMIDNSVSMADKQEILGFALPELVDRLVNPGCVDAQGALIARASSAEAACPAGSREFTPIRDINLGVITSSLGDAGANTSCVGSVGDASGKNDGAHLLGSLRPRPELLPLAQTLGQTNAQFLRWRGQDQPTFEAAVAQLVLSAEDQGCGFEASLEAWYRFLVDPHPPLSLSRQPCEPGAASDDCVVASQEVDQVVLDQRAAFLRPGSLVAVVMLSDENDCSIRAGGRNWFTAADGRLFAATQMCATDPNHRCCHSCAQLAPEGCAPDPGCVGEDGLPTRLSAERDSTNLRCFEQKRRFGVDFLYPTARYVNALTQPRLCTRRADLDPRPDLGVNGCSDEQLVDNPLFRRFDPSLGRTETQRDPDLVFLAGIVGVPWQLIRATGDSKDNPYDPAELRFLTAQQLSQPSLPGNPASVGWDNLVPGSNPAALDPHLTESPLPRPGLAAPGSAFGADLVHGHEHNLAGNDNLQFSCTFDLPTAQTCSTTLDRSCDCSGPDPASEQSPLCQQPDGSYSNVQLRAKAFPPLRQLDVLKGLDNSIVASICARNVDLDARQAQDFGYRPAVDALVDRLREALNNRCFPRSLAVTRGQSSGGQATARASCALVEVETNAASCSCESLAGRSTPTPEVSQAVFSRLLDVPGLCASAEECASACLCSLEQLQDDALAQCQYQERPDDGINGWCYIDPASGFGNPALIQGCQATEQRLLRFVPDQLLRNDATTFVACFGASQEDTGVVQAE